MFFFDTRIEKHETFFFGVTLLSFYIRRLYLSHLLFLCQCALFFQSVSFLKANLQKIWSWFIRQIQKTWKILKKGVSKMETQLVSIICRFYCRSLLKSIRFFSCGPSKKKSKKELGPFSGTFWKIFFFKVTLFAWFFLTLALKNLQHFFCKQLSYVVASDFYWLDSSESNVNVLFF